MTNTKIRLALAMLLFGSIGLFVRNIDLSSSQIALARGVIGSIFLLFASQIVRQKISLNAIKSNWLLLTLSGAAIGINWIFLFEAYKYTTISNATLSYYFAPVFVIFLAPFILKERLTLIKTLCIAGAMTGMFLIVGTGNSAGELNHMLGIGYGLAAAALYASVVLMNKFLKGLSGLESTLIQLSIAGLVVLPYVLATEKVQYLSLDRQSIFLLLTVCIIHTGLGYFIYFSSIQKLSGQTIASFSYIDPISAIIMSSIILGEQMTVLQIMGGILILGATFMSEIFGERSLTNKERLNSR